MSERSLEVLEASYRLALPDREWLYDLTQAVLTARPVGDMGMSAMAFLFTSSPTGERFRPWNHLAMDVPDEFLAVLRSFHTTLDPEAVRARYWQQAALCATLSQLGLPASPAQSSVGVREILGFQATDVSGVGFCMLFQLPRETSLLKPVSRHWAAVARHVRAALRLRLRLAGRDPWSLVEAVIDPAQPGGRVTHACGRASVRDAQDMLRQIACNIDRMRTRRTRTQDQRSQGDAALRAWPVLASGRWTVLEHFESDGRRCYIALRNEPEAASLVTLTSRERDVVAQAVLGVANKIIADALGLTEPTVKTHLRHAMAKLRVRSRAELVALGNEVDFDRVLVGDDELAILRARDDLTRRLDRSGLTQAEKEVAFGILHGQSNEVIARARGSHVRTVANQVQSLYRKMGVCSRAELVALLSGRVEA